MTEKQVQLLLSYLGYSPGEIDGVAGEKTRSAVRAFQQAEGLAADGTVGEKTQQKLKEAVFRGRLRKQETGDFWKDIRYFSRSEPYIACPCGRCGGFPVEPAEKLMRLADSVRDAAGKPMIPTSTVRCKAHNADVGGVWNSRHMLGHAMDFRIQGLTAAQSLAIVRQQSGVVYAYAIDGQHVHMDIGN